VSVALDGSSGAGQVLAEGYDFYSTPRLSPDGRQLAWICWRHPNMPWDGTELWLADVAADGSLANARRVAGGDTESIYQPGWSPRGELLFVSDRDDRWRLYSERRGEPSGSPALGEIDEVRPR
jgi:Tol biopolymer transport system component